jgi:hypothetical protein
MASLAQPFTRLLHHVVSVGGAWGAVTNELGQLGLCAAVDEGPSLV